MISHGYKAHLPAMKFHPKPESLESVVSCRGVRSRRQLRFRIAGRNRLPADRFCGWRCGYCGQRKSAMCHTINRLLRSDRARSSLSWRWRGPGGGTPPRIRRLGRSSNSCGTASKSDAGVLAGGPKTTTRRTAGSSRKVIECDRRFPDVFERADYAKSPKVSRML